MKKSAAVLLAVLFVISLCACDNASSNKKNKIPAGTYKATSFSAGGETVEGEEALGMFKDFSIVILDGKRAQMVYGEQTHTVDYTLNGEKFTLGDGDMQGTYKDGKIYLDFGGAEGGSIIFEKVD